MSSIHADPKRYGVTFGSVTATVDAALGDCVLHTQRPGPTGPVPIQKRFHSLDEIQGAYAVQSAHGNERSDIARALKFAASQLMEARGRV